MTNRAYLEAQVGALLGAEQLNALALSNSLMLDAPAEPNKCLLALYNDIPMLLLSASRSITEGGYSISVNAEGLRLYYRALATRLGKPNLLEATPRPKVRYRSM